MRWRRKEWMLGVMPAVVATLGLTEAAQAERAEWSSSEFSQKLPPALEQAMAWPQAPKAEQEPVSPAPVAIPPGAIFIMGFRP